MCKGNSARVTFVHTLPKSFSAQFWMIYICMLCYICCVIYLIAIIISSSSINNILSVSQSVWQIGIATWLLSFCWPIRRGWSFVTNYLRRGIVSLRVAEVNWWREKSCYGDVCCLLEVLRWEKRVCLGEKSEAYLGLDDVMVWTRVQLWSGGGESLFRLPVEVRVWEAGWDETH